MEASSSQRIVLGATDRLATAVDPGTLQRTVSMRAWLNRPPYPLRLMVSRRCIAGFDRAVSLNFEDRITWFGPCKVP